MSARTPERRNMICNEVCASCEMLIAWAMFLHARCMFANWDNTFWGDRYANWTTGRHRDRSPTEKNDVLKVHFSAPFFVTFFYQNTGVFGDIKMGKIDALEIFFLFFCNFFHGKGDVRCFFIENGRNFHDIGGRKNNIGGNFNNIGPCFNNL